MSLHERNRLPLHDQHQAEDGWLAQYWHHRHIRYFKLCPRVRLNESADEGYKEGRVGIWQGAFVVPASDTMQ